MQIHAGKNRENKSQPVTDAVSGKKNDNKRKPVFQLEDNRPGAIRLQKLQEMANDNTQKNFPQFGDNRPEVAQMKRLQKLANNSPRNQQFYQLQKMADERAANQKQPIQKNENNTGLPDNLKSGIESLSGYAMDDVKVHYNSDKPAQLNAHAYAQGADIHIGSGQEKHLPHETWHVVQQKQGRVKPTMQMKGGVNINDDGGLEKEADVMGAKALQMKPKVNNSREVANAVSQQKSNGRQGLGFVNNRPVRAHQLSHDGLTMTKTFYNSPVQRVIGAELEVDGPLVYDPTIKFNQGTVIGKIPHGSGNTTEIHAENPQITKGQVGDVGVMGMEFATGKYNTVAGANISQMPQDAQELTDKTKEIKKGEKKYFNFQGFGLQHLKGELGNIQINVSPNKGKTQSLVGFLGKGPTLNLPEKEEQRGHANNVVPDQSGYGTIYNLLMKAAEKYISVDTNEEAEKDQIFFAGIIPTLVIHIVGLISYNYRTQAKSFGNTQKNAFEAMPRFDLWTLILSKLRESYGKESSLDDEGFKKFVRPAKSLVSMMDVLKGQVEEIVIKSESSTAHEIAYKGETLKSDLRKYVEECTINQIIQLITAKAILVPSRPDPSNDGDTILHGTDTTKIPLNPEKSPEGAYEIRTPFVEKVPIDQWTPALKQYETRLYDDGVRYLIDQ